MIACFVRVCVLHVYVRCLYMCIACVCTLEPNKRRGVSQLLCVFTVAVRLVCASVLHVCVHVQCLHVWSSLDMQQQISTRHLPSISYVLPCNLP